MGNNSFAPYTKKYGCFIALNISDCNNDHGPCRKKVVRVFNYPILPAQSRDLLQIPGVSESDIRASLLKGELRHKILARDIVIICSDIDLLQFNDDQKKFLQDAGIVHGLEAGGIGPPGPPGAGVDYLFREEIPLIGAKNGTNRTFMTPEKFINGVYSGNNFHIHVKHNGKDLYEGIDYVVSESGGIGTGYDMVTLKSFSPNSHSLLICDYMVKTP